MVNDFDIYFGVVSNFLLDGRNCHLRGEFEDEAQMFVWDEVVVRGNV